MDPRKIKAYKPVQLFDELDSFKNYVVTMQSPLYGYIQELYQFDLSEVTGRSFYCLPDASTDLIFFIKSNLADSILLGNYPRADYSPLQDCVHVFGIRFFIGAFNAFFNIPAHEFLKEAITPTKDVLNTDVLGDILGSHDDFEERVSACMNYFCKATRSYEVPAIVRYGVASILISNGNIQISKMAEEMGYSERYIRKMFAHYVGISPKTLCEIVKFQSVISEYMKDGSTSMEELAFKNEYYDLAHLYKSFRKFAGCAPGELRSKL